MEIISYVQDNSRRRLRSFALPSLPKKITSPVFSPELKSFSAQRVQNQLSVKFILKTIGSAVSIAAEFLFENIKRITIVALAVLLISAVFISSFALINHKKNYTGPLVLESDGSADIENLNRLMASFALEGSVDYDESGKLLDSKAAASSLFTQPVTYQTYKVKAGDTISGIAKKFGLTNISTLISVNDIGNVRQLGAGQKLKIPSIDGIIYTVKAGDTLEKIATSNNIKLENILDVNELTTETLTVGQQLFLPGVGLDQKTLQSRMGELFILPISASFRWSSPYGWRADPFTGVQSFHTGTDMACPEGTPILAAMSGRIADVGYNRTYGNYIIINHGNGYQTLYAHMSKTIASKGQWVSQGTKIGLVGSTGYSTGPHLHFMVYKNGNRIDPMTVLKK